MQATLDGRTVEDITTADIRAYLTNKPYHPFAEIWLEAEESGPLLAMLVNDHQAVLIYLGDREGDPGLTSRNASYAGPPHAMLTCRLSNGQFDEYPLAWAIPIEQALLICDHFIQTGELYDSADYPFADGDGHLAGR